MLLENFHENFWENFLMIFRKTLVFVFGDFEFISVQVISSENNLEKKHSKKVNS